MYYDLNAMNMIIFSILHIFVIEWTLSEKDDCIFHLGYSFMSLAFLGRHQGQDSFKTFPLFWGRFDNIKRTDISKLTVLESMLYNIPFQNMPY